jgi:hypothetical protein
MSNAQRQAEYRRRLKARASLDALGEQAAKAADRAIEALWTFYNRPTLDGDAWGDLDGFADLAAFKAYIAEHGELWDWCENSLRGWREYGATDEEAAAWQTVVDATNALLAKPKRKGSGKRSR